MTSKSFYTTNKLQRIRLASTNPIWGYDLPTHTLYNINKQYASREITCVILHYVIRSFVLIENPGKAISGSRNTRARTSLLILINWNARWVTDITRVARGVERTHLGTIRDKNVVNFTNYTPKSNLMGRGQGHAEPSPVVFKKFYRYTVDFVASLMMIQKLFELFSVARSICSERVLYMYYKYLKLVNPVKNFFVSV